MTLDSLQKEQKKGLIRDDCVNRINHLLVMSMANKILGEEVTDNLISSFIDVQIAKYMHNIEAHYDDSVEFISSMLGSDIKEDANLAMTVLNDLKQTLTGDNK